MRTATDLIQVAKYVLTRAGFMPIIVQVKPIPSPEDQQSGVGD